MRRWSSLRSSAEVRRVQREGRRARRGPVMLWATARPGPSRAALAVPARPAGNVARNLVRRRLRAVLDEILPPEGWDVVVGVRGRLPVPHRELSDALRAAWVALTGGGEGPPATAEIE